MKLEDRINRSIKQRASVVVLRSDFDDMGSDSHVGRVLALSDVAERLLAEAG